MFRLLITFATLMPSISSSAGPPTYPATARGATDADCSLDGPPDKEAKEDGSQSATSASSRRTTTDRSGDSGTSGSS